MSRVVVTVFATSRRLDLAVPDEVPVERLLPEIAEVFAADPQSLWALTPMGGGPLPAARSLSECGIFQGAVLLLVEQGGRTARGRPQERLPPAPPRVTSPAPLAAPPPAPPPPPQASPAPLPPAALPSLTPLTPGRTEIGPGLRFRDLVGALGGLFQPRAWPAPAERRPYWFPGPATARPAALVDLLVLGGPGAGLRVPLAEGEHRVGSHRYSSVVLDDPTLSRVHLAASVGGGGEVTVADAEPELGSLLEGGRLTDPSRVRPGQAVAAGRSLITFVPTGGLPPEPPGGAGLAERRFRLAAPPAPRRVSWPRTAGIALTPTVLAAAFYGLSHLDPIWLLLMVLSPAAVAATEIWRHSRHQAAVQVFRDQLAGVEGELAAAREAEAARLRAGTPDAVRVIELAPRDRDRPRRRQPGAPDWLTLRIGWMDVASDVSLDLAPGGDPALREEASQTLARHQVLNAVPALVSLRDVGTLGVAGEGAAVAGLCRWLGLQLASSHSPDELCLLAAVDAGDREEWAWLEWLPHAAQRPSALPGAGPVVTGERVGALLDGLERLLEQRLTASDQGAAGAGVRHEGAAPAVVAFLDGRAGLRSAAVSRLLLHGPAAGVHLVWLGDEAWRVPAECGVVVDAPAGHQPPTLYFRRRGTRYQLGGVDGVSLPRAIDAARGLGDQPAVPARVELTELLALPGDVERHVLEGWIRDRSGGASPALAAACGLGTQAALVTVDLRPPGHHLLVGGTAGSGKSELLRSLAVTLAMQRSPRTLALMLVDPRGSLEPCARLPHVVSWVTDLRGGAGRQVLDGLRQELGRRRAILHEAGAAAIEEVEQERSERTPARLLVLVDEVFDLLASAPDAAHDLVEAGQEGGRLGVHLVLSTAHAGDLAASLAALTGPRVALRCSDGGESDALIGVSDAGRSGLPPGRGFLRSVGGQVAEFQAAAASGEQLTRVVEAIARVNQRLNLPGGARR